MSPISRLVVVRRRPPSSVLSRTLARTGSVLRLETARLTTARPRARFSCMTESFTSGPLQGRGGSRRFVREGCAAQGPGSREVASVWCAYLPRFSWVRHHRHNDVERVDGRARSHSKCRWSGCPAQWTAPPDSGTAEGSKGGHPHDRVVGGWS